MQKRKWIIFYFCSIMSTPRRDNQFLGDHCVEIERNPQRRGVSQQRVTMDTGVNISRIESGNRMPSIYSLAILCKYYEVSMEEFFKNIDLKNKPWE